MPLRRPKGDYRVTPCPVHDQPASTQYEPRFYVSDAGEVVDEQERKNGYGVMGESQIVQCLNGYESRLAAMREVVEAGNALAEAVDHAWSDGYSVLSVQPIEDLLQRYFDSRVKLDALGEGEG